MKVPSNAFPGAELSRHLCDFCKKPIVLVFKRRGSDEEFCSNKCLLAKENNEMSETATATAPEAEGTPTNSEKAPKKEKEKTKVATKKAAAKGKTKAAKAKGSVKEHRTRSRYPAEAKITVVKKEHSYRGKRAELFKLLLTAKTVGDFLDKMKAKKYGSSTRAIARAVEAGLVKVSKA